MIRLGTPYFVSFMAANRYYRPYGYDDQFIQIAANMLIKAGYFADWNEFNDWHRNNHAH